MKKIKLVINDFHLSRGKWLQDGRRNPLEDFSQDERFREFLEYYSTGQFEAVEVELIINGDFFDPLAVMPPDISLHELRKLEFPIDVEESAAVFQIASHFLNAPSRISLKSSQLLKFVYVFGFSCFFCF